MITILEFQHMENIAMLILIQLMLVRVITCKKDLKKIGNERPIHIKTRSPNKHPLYKTNFNIKPIDNNKGSVVVFDDML